MLSATALDWGNRGDGIKSSEWKPGPSGVAILETFQSPQ
jgi:hypothetical protein